MMWSCRCRISLLLLYCVKCHSLWDHVTNCTVLGVWCIFFPPAVDIYDITFYVYWLQIYMSAKVEVHHLRWQYEIYRASNLRVESAHQIFVNNIYFIVYHILKRVLGMMCSNCQMRFTPGEQTILKAVWITCIKVVSLMVALILNSQGGGGYLTTTFNRISSASWAALIYCDKICITFYDSLVSEQLFVCSCELDFVRLKMSDNTL